MSLKEYKPGTTFPGRPIVRPGNAALARLSKNIIFQKEINYEYRG